MSGDSTIEWTDKTWNPVSGCSHVSPGCKNCYAEKIANRFKGRKAFPNGFKVTLHPERLQAPLGWKKPAKIFVNSMSDLFHEDVTTNFIFKVFGVMVAARQHTFQVLTKRPQRMLEFVRHIGAFPNIWLGVSVEDQKRADERIPLLLQCPAAVRFLSCEPLLGLVDLSHWAFTNDVNEGIDWVIVGGESGPGARPMHPDWARSLRDQCQAAGVPFFFKQWGTWGPYNLGRDRAEEMAKLENPKTMDTPLRRHGKKLAGRLLDGREWNEFPEVTHAV